MEQYRDFFYTIGIKAGHLFSLHENNPDFLLAPCQINISKTMQYLFSNESIYIQGFPVSAMTNKENKLKLEYYRMNDSASIIIRPQSWHRLYLSNIGEIDFNVIDNCNN